MTTDVTSRRYSTNSLIIQFLKAYGILEALVYITILIQRATGAKYQLHKSGYNTFISQFTTKKHNYNLNILGNIQEQGSTKFLQANSLENRNKGSTE